MSADNWTTCPKCGCDLREDYELGIDKAVFEVSYRAYCNGDGNLPRSERFGCGFNFTFEHKVKVI